MDYSLIALVLVALALAQSSSVTASNCACATTSVHVRSGAGTSHSVLGTLTSGHCVTYKTTSGGWVEVDYNGRNGWISSHYVNVGPCGSHATSSGGARLSGCPRIISRSEWGARAPRHHPGNLHALPKYVFIHHGTGAFCHSESECSHIVRQYQNYHMDGHHWSDIGYSFVVGEDGNAYEARGWSKIGAHTKGYNSVGIAICVIGDFTHRVPNDAALNTIKQLIQCGLDNHKISPSYHLLGHRDVGSTACPGQKLWELIHSWPHYGK